MASWWTWVFVFTTLLVLSEARRFVVPTISEYTEQYNLIKTASTVDLSHLMRQFPEHNLSIPIDHFHNDSIYEPHSSGYFDLRYWFDASHYKQGGPVIVFLAGEDDGAGRLPLIQKGLMADLASELNGIGIVLEHRYYGTSFPTEDLSTPNLRFLTTDQANADAAYFAQHIVLPGLEHENITAPNVPWIAYGVSYSGGQAAFVRKLYPDIFWGAISSSGVTQAIDDYWQYLEPVRQYGPGDCIQITQNMTDVVDKILIDSQNITLSRQLKDVFRLREVRDDADFANILTYGIMKWQSRNWDSDIGSGKFMHYCNNITSPSLLYSQPASLISSVFELISITGYDNTSNITTNFLNWIGFLNLTIINSLFDPTTSNLIPSLIETRNLTPLLDSSSSSPYQNRWFCWLYQVCTQWGYFITGSGFPSTLDRGLPLISRLITLPYTSEFCHSLFSISTRPNLTAINQYGGYEISYPRLAIVGGIADPWKPATPMADEAPARDFNSITSDSEPWILIDVPENETWDRIRGAVHHWEANGVLGNETGNNNGLQTPPKDIKDAQREIIRFVGEWIDEWNEEKERRKENYKDNEIEREQQQHHHHQDQDQDQDQNQKLLHGT
ncbi:putative extracelular serine [Phaeomoniella chlamydospora]|uniref:Putative extracelular serine n=1 Tax=Phaeomoniella chlamydospora TaxID=158046 RepID=A0A0G2G7S1_PHACM|nr:putative extracelular serine [Phaeomoniella chlamydospora]